MGKATTVEIPPLNTEILELTLIGDAPLICHKFSEKAKKEMEDKHAKKAKGPRKKRDPDKEFRDSLHRLNGEKNFSKAEFGFPASGLKKGMIWVAADIEGVAGTQVKRHIHIIADEGHLLKIHGDRPRKRDDVVRVGMGSADMRYRGEFVNWHMKPRVKFNCDVFSKEQVINLINHVGVESGLGEWRPSAPKSPDEFGIFHIATEEEAKGVEDGI